MVDAPWRTHGPLNYCMVRQRLHSLGCTELGDVAATGAVRWKTPTGRVFSVSKEDIDAETLHQMVEWIQQSGRNA